MIKTEWKNNEYSLSTDRAVIDVKAVHQFLSQTYWSENIPLEIVQKSIDNSLCFTIHKSGQLVGFARVISDFATFAYLADVFILPHERQKGLSKWMMEIILDHPQLQGLRRFILATRDAHGLYTQFGFGSFNNPERWMQIHNPEVYKQKSGEQK